MHAQEPVLRVALFVNHREDQSRQLGMLIVYEAMRGEMDDAILTKVYLPDGVSARLKVHYLQTRSPRDRRDDCICLFTRGRQRWDASVLDAHVPQDLLHQLRLFHLIGGSRFCQTYARVIRPEHP